MRRVATGIAVCLVMLASADCALAQKGGAKKARQLEVETRPWKGDFDQMLERRVIPRCSPLQPLALLHRQRATSAGSLRT
jgi:hypothetical protein